MQTYHSNTRTRTPAVPRILGSMSGTRRKVLVAVTAAMACLGAHAQSTAASPDAVYWGVGLGQSRMNLPSGVLFPSESRDTSWKLTVGKPLGNVFGAEVSAFDLGKLARGGGQTQAQGVSLNMVARLPVDRFALYGKLGATYYRTDVTTAVLSDVTAGRVSGWGPSAGVGVSYDLTRSTALFAEWDRHRMSFAGDDRRDVDNGTVGLRWAF